MRKIWFAQNVIGFNDVMFGWQSKEQYYVEAMLKIMSQKKLMLLYITTWEKLPNSI